MRLVERIERLLTDLELDAGKELVDKLVRYVELWQRWNFKVRLTSKMSVDEFVNSQLAESLLLYRLFGESGRYLDVGSGGGLPGIPIALLTGFDTALVESNYKKAAFLKLCKRELDVPWLDVYHGRIEELDEIRRIAPFRYITARAVAPVRDILLWTADLASDETVYLLPKGDKAEPELKEAEDLLRELGFAARMEKLTHPGRDRPYQVIVLTKR